MTIRKRRVGLRLIALAAGALFVVGIFAARHWWPSDGAADASSGTSAVPTELSTGSITARVNTIEEVNAWAKAGVMMRETLDAGSRHAMVVVSPGKGLAFQRRPTTGGSRAHISAGMATAPYWVQLARASNSFTASVSPNGSAWTTVGSVSVEMAPVTRHSDGTLATATLDDIAVVP